MMDDHDAPKRPHAARPSPFTDGLRDVHGVDPLLPAPWALTLEDIPGGDHHLLHRSQLDADLTIDFQRWAFSDPTPEDPETVELFLDTFAMPVQQRSWTQPIAADDLFIQLPQRYLTQGRHEVFYRVTLGQAGVSSDSQLFSFYVDTRVPELGGDRGRLSFPDEVQDGLTAGYLAAHDDRVRALAPDHSPLRVGDTLTWYWETTPVGIDEAGRRTLTLVDIGLPIALDFEGERIRAAGDGIFYASYEVTSRAGYTSRLSVPAALEVRVLPVPRQLPAPELYDSYGEQVLAVLQPLQAREGVTLRVPAGATLYPQERIEVQWGRPGDVGAQAMHITIHGEGPWSARVPTAAVLACMGKRVIIDYVLLEDDQGMSSEALSIDVADFSLANLPQVQSKAGNEGHGRISLQTLETGDTISLRPWPMAATTQRIKLWAEGIDAQGVSSEYWMLAGQPVTVGHVNNGVNVSLPKGWLATLSHYLPLEVYVQVSFDGGLSWKAFPSSGVLQVVP